MPSSLGPIDWPAPVARRLQLDGLWIDAFLDPLSFGEADGPAELLMADGSTVEQSTFHGWGVPLDLRRDTISLGIPVMGDDELLALRTIQARGRSVAFWPEEPRTDIWLAAAGPDGVLGVTEWSTSRILAYGTVDGVTLDTHPAQAWLDGVAQTIVTGAPSAGQVQIIAGTGAQNRAVRTPALTAGQELRLYYYPLLYVRVRAERSLHDANAYDWQGTLTEVLPGAWA